MASGDPYTNLPVDMYGLSNQQDGMVPDPSKQYDLMNVVLYKFYSDAITENAAGILPATFVYTYTATPRQKLPRYVYWVNVGYTVTF